MAVRVIALMVLFSLALSAGEAKAQVRELAHYKITGVWSGRILCAIETKPPENSVEAGDGEIEGRSTILDIEKKILQIGPVTVQWSESNRFEHITSNALKIATPTEIAGQIVGPRRLLATTIKRGPVPLKSDLLSILGPVTNVDEKADGSAQLKVISVPVSLPREVYGKVRTSLLEADEEDEPASIPAGFAISGEYEAILDYRRDFALNNQDKDDLFRLDQELQFRLTSRHNDWISLFVEAKVLGETELYAEGRSRSSDEFLERGETWVRFDKLFGHDLSLQVGRQNIVEPRRWWWDDDLDAVRVRYRLNPWSFELGLARELGPTSTLENFIDPEEKEVIRVLGRLNWRLLKNHSLGLFFLHQNDSSRTPSLGSLVKSKQEDPSDAKLWWGGLRAMGRVPLNSYGGLFYWADAAIVLGKEKVLEFDQETRGLSRVISRRDQRVRGWGFDLGGRWAPPLPGQPIFTLGYALGSGDRRPGKGSDRAFRQTGLQSSDEEFRTYGELLRPELSNLNVSTLAVEFPTFSDSRVEFAYRHFRQQHAAPFLRDGRIEAEPTGKSPNIGQEWMLLFGIKEWEDLEIELVGAAFRAGHAYGEHSGKMAYSVFMKFAYGF